MKRPRFKASAVVALSLVLAIEASPWLASASQITDATGVISGRCMSCHDTETREAGIDLTPLLKKNNLSEEKITKLWIRVERMVSRGEMPPKDEGPLTPKEKETIQQWFHETFVLRQGKAHIGPTPLRRLTRYELEKTLEDVLSVKLKAPYRDTITGRIDLSKIESTVPSDIPGPSGFDNDAQRMESLKPPLKEIANAVHFALERFNGDATALQTVLGRAEIPKDASDMEARQLIGRLLSRAYRGNQPRVQSTLSVFYDLYAKHHRVSKDSRESLQYVFEMILVSPGFLYRLEDSKNLDTPYPVTGFELATRLSYFLWSTSPDAELLRLAEDNSLLQDDILKSQVARMLNSPKRISLAERFAGQWLGFDDLLSNSEYFLDERWNRETYDEALFFFDELIKSDRSFLELVQSDWIYKRSSMLKSGRHGYTVIDPASVKNVYADIFSNRQSKSKDRRASYDPPVLVKTKNDQEGGIITSPAIMRLTASKTRTSPIRRGVWVLNTVIGKTLEPPPNIPSLEEARMALKIKRNPSVAELLKQHVSRSECVSCHKAIDPLGLGLENYAPNGRWRTRYPDKAPVVSGGVMPNGKTFSTPREMKGLLLELYKDEIAENFVKKMFAYALGRNLEPFDRVALEPILRTVKDNGYQIDTVLEQIVLSKQFRCRQDR